MALVSRLQLCTVAHACVPYNDNEEKEKKIHDNHNIHDIE